MVLFPLVPVGFPSSPYSTAECYFLFLRFLIIVLDFQLEAVVTKVPILSKDSMERLLVAYKDVFMVSGQSLS